MKSLHLSVCLTLPHIASGQGLYQLVGDDLSSLPSYCQNSSAFISNLSLDTDFSGVELVLPCTNRPSFIVIFDRLTDSFDAVNIDNYVPGEDAADYYYANSARGFFDLEEVPASESSQAGYRDLSSGLFFTSFGIDHFQSLAGTFSAFSQIQQLHGLSLNGAHHRNLIDSAIGTGIYTWATGDIANYDELDGTQAQGEVGISHDFGRSNFRAGISLGYTDLSQDLVLDGTNDADGEFLTVEANYRLPDTPVTLSGLLYVGSSELDLTRRYANGGLIDSSSGSTDIDSVAFRARVDWNAYEKERLTITPRLSFTWSQTETDGFAEKGGGFPVSYDAQSDYQREIRVGLDADYQVSEKLSVRAIAEYFYTWDDPTTLSGNITGITPFSFTSQDLSGGAVRGGVEVAYDLTPNQRVFMSFFSSTSDTAPSFSGAISYGYQF